MEFQCSSEFGPDELVTADSPHNAAEIYAENHVDTETEEPRESVDVKVEGLWFKVDVIHNGYSFCSRGGI